MLFRKSQTTNNVYWFLIKPQLLLITYKTDIRLADAKREMNCLVKYGLNQEVVTYLKAPRQA